MDRIEREKHTVQQMVAIYCSGRHHHALKDPNSKLCAECSALLAYALARLSHCPHGNKKPTCQKCTIHCYAPSRREEIRNVMRYAGPRMLLHHPIAAILHLIDNAKK